MKIKNLLIISLLIFPLYSLADQPASQGQEDSYFDKTIKIESKIQKKIDKKVAVVEKKVDVVLNEVTPNQTSPLEKRWHEESELTSNPLMITLYRPTYILPYYDTTSPYSSIYVGNTPNEQRIMNAEFKAQMSVVVPIIHHLFYRKDTSLNIAYTQLNYWQVYASSQYFRETNYEPEIFVEDHFHRNWLARIGLDHQSNGRGGVLERSWNRAMGTIQCSGENWLASITIWNLIFRPESSNLHNPDIGRYLGHENLLFAYNYRKAILSFQVQNIESGLQRGFFMGTVSYPITKNILFYTQYFNGFGQSLIEYNHRTQGLGLGIAFNDWI